jgi:hypothetical protein
MLLLKEKNQTLMPIDMVIIMEEGMVDREINKKVT